VVVFLPSFTASDPKKYQQELLAARGALGTFAHRDNEIGRKEEERRRGREQERER
jgi:hypothetical protein